MLLQNRGYFVYIRFHVRKKYWQDLRIGFKLAFFCYIANEVCNALVYCTVHIVSKSAGLEEKHKTVLVKDWRYKLLLHQRDNATSRKLMRWLTK